MFNVLTAIIVEDERPAREELLFLLKEYKQLRVVALCKNALEARTEIDKQRPDVVFLDISMPGQSGFELLTQLKFVPEIIFTTAYEQYALQAFEENALDYLLKPIRAERLTKTLAKIEEKLNYQQIRENRLNRQLFLKDGIRHYFVLLAQIYLFESWGNYTRFCFSDKILLQYTTLKEVEAWLPKETFIRINRRQIINKEFIKLISTFNTRSLKIELVNGRVLYTSNRQASILKNQFLK